MAVASLVAGRSARGFGLVWFGQAISLVGSGMSEFALSLWVYQRTGSVTQFAFVLLFKVLPVIVLSPLAGVAADRWDRRRIMLVGDTGAALSVLALALLFAAGRLELWHVYIGVALSAACGAFQTPAYLASLAQMVPARQLGRANGLLQFGQAAADIATPVLAGALVSRIHLHGVILLDCATFLFAVSMLLLVRWDAPPGSAEAHGALGHVRAGWAYLWRRPGLAGLLLFFALIYFLGGLISALLPPLVLSIAPAATLGTILSVAGLGFLVGSLGLAVWGGPRRRAAGLFGFGLLFGSCLLLIGARPAVLWIALSAFGGHLALPIVVGLNQAIWQSAVPPEMQGRVFALRQMVTRGAQPLALLLAGPLADRVFEPRLAASGAWAERLGPLVGSGPGRGIGLMFVVMGAVVLLASAAGLALDRKAA